MKLFQKTLLFLILGLVEFGCRNHSKSLFLSLSEFETGVHFTNENTDRDSLSILDYLYFYNGAGVSIGDINNDGLPDIFLVSNTGGNKLFLNKGNFHFEDITQKSGVGGHADWQTGVTMVDINGDGLLDIYVCAVGDYIPRDHIGAPKMYFQNSRNQLFINNGNNTFTESAKKWGLDIQGYNTQAVFFDLDNDGDLDMFLLQHSTHQTDSYGPVSLRNKYSSESGGKLYRNDGDHFTDITPGSGIYSSAVGYGLGVGVADFNQDGFEDIYVSNDFHENDYYYVNQGNGTFKEMNGEAFGHVSKYSMGSDIADINHDGWLDIMTVDMLPENIKVLKSSLSDDPLDVYMYQRSFGYSHQYSKNSLQINIGKGKRFADISLYSGVSATDWSWSPLIADYNLDGKEDIFVSNGIKRRPNDLDYVRFASSLPQRNTHSGPRIHDKEMLNKMPSGEWHSYIFEGQGDLKFLDRSQDWGFDQVNLSQGAAYGDLNGDGSLDLVINCMNHPAGIYKNQIRELNPHNHYLEIALKGKAPNTFGLGTKVFLFNHGEVFYKEMQTVRGFMSSGEPLLNFGLGKITQVDSIWILWPDQSRKTLYHVSTNQKLEILYEKENLQKVKLPEFIDHLIHGEDTPTFKDITSSMGKGFWHKENNFYDFNEQSLIPHEYSALGPKIAIGDINGDGTQDFFITGARGQTGKIFFQDKNGNFIPSNDTLTFEKDKDYEGVDAIFFDADGDGDLDLYVVSGGNEFISNAPELNDRLYLNNGKGHFSRSDQIPKIFENKSIARVADFDHDGDLDIFVGGKSITRDYGQIPDSYLLINDGKGHFTQATGEIAQSLKALGRVSDATWIDVDHDGWMDLVVVGEWMEPILFMNYKGKLKRKPISPNDSDLKGWWSCIQAADIDGDGWDDLLLGNYGLNSKLSPSKVYPLKMYLSDWIESGRKEPILAIEKNQKYFPFLNKEDLEKELPYLKKKFLGYDEMADKSMDEIFGPILQKASVSEANNFASMIFMNTKKGYFQPKILPSAFQWSPIFSFQVLDLNHDRKMDILSGGNFFGTLPYEGRYDAMPLVLALGQRGNRFTPQIPIPNAFEDIRGEVRSIVPIQLNQGKRGLLVGLNNGKLRLLQIQ